MRFDPRRPASARHRGAARQSALPHRLCSDWLGSGRERKFAMVAKRQ
jgi:hypothetical protein